MKFISKFLYAIIGFLVSMVAIYLMEAFVVGNLDPFSWERPERLVYFIMVIILWQLIPVFMLVYSPKKRD